MTCPDCDGRGVIFRAPYDGADPGDAVERACSFCRGTGDVEREPVAYAKQVPAGLRFTPETLRHDAGTNTRSVLEEVARERTSQDVRWGVQNHPDGDVPLLAHELRKQRQNECDLVDKEGTTTWRHILAEEWAEVLDALDDPEELRKELIQVAGVAVAWIECIDRRNQ